MNTHEGKVYLIDWSIFIILQVYLCTVLFQAAEGQAIPDHISQQIVSCCDRANPWLAYKLARQALRFGQCAVAESVFNTLTQKVR